jgi:hypothetical protein
MLKYLTILATGGALLAGCTALRPQSALPPAPPPPQLKMEAVLRINHSPQQSADSWYQLARYHQQRGERDLARAAYAKSLALDVRSRAALPAPLPAVPAPAPVTTAAPAARMELVQVAPQVYQLKLAERPAAAPVPGARLAARAFKVTIANGNGAPGMAMLARQLVNLHGIAVSRLSNERPYRQQQTQIQYPTGWHRQAQALKDALQGHAILVCDARLPANADLRLVLGKDAILPMTLRQGFGPTLASN